MGARRLVAALVATVVLVVLAGCTPDDDVTDPPTTATTPSESVEPTTDVSTDPSTDVAPTPPDLDPPERPESMDVDDLEGAGAAVTYFFDLVVYAFATGDTSDLERSSASTCTYCTNTVNAVEEMHESGSWSDTPPIEVRDLQLAYPYTTDPNYLAVFTLIAPDNTTYDADGVATPFDGYTREGAAMSISVSDGRFVVAEFDSTPDA